MNLHLSPRQLEALNNPVNPTDELQVRWNAPVMFRYNKKKTWSVVIAVVNGGDKHEWIVGVRMLMNNKSKFKPHEEWSLTERLDAFNLAKDWLTGAGDTETEKETPFELGIVLSRTITADEFSAMVKPGILGTLGVNTNGNANRPILYGGPGLNGKVGFGLGSSGKEKAEAEISEHSDDGGRDPLAFDLGADVLEDIEEPGEKETDL